MKPSNKSLEGTNLKISIIRKENDLSDADVDEIVALRKAKYEVWYKDMVDKMLKDAYDEVSK